MGHVGISCMACAERLGHAAKRLISLWMKASNSPAPAARPRCPSSAIDLRHLGRAQHRQRCRRPCRCAMLARQAGRAPNEAGPVDGFEARQRLGDRRPLRVQRAALHAGHAQHLHLPGLDEGLGRTHHREAERDLPADACRCTSWPRRCRARAACSMPAMWLSISPASCAEVPMPLEPNESLPGCCLGQRDQALDVVGREVGRGHQRHRVVARRAPAAAGPSRCRRAGPCAARR